MQENGVEIKQRVKQRGLSLLLSFIKMQENGVEIKQRVKQRGLSLLLLFFLFFIIFIRFDS